MPGKNGKTKNGEFNMLSTIEEPTTNTAEEVRPYEEKKAIPQVGYVDSDGGEDDTRSSNSKPTQTDTDNEY